MALIEQFTTTSVRASARLDYWNRLANETYPGLFIDAAEPDLRADMLRWKLGEMTLSRPRSQASVAQRTCPAAGEPAIMLHYQRYGFSRQVQRGLSCDLSAGDLAICSSDEPYRLELSPKHEILVVELPRAKLERSLRNLDDCIGRRFSGLTASGRILNSFLLSLWTEGDHNCGDAAWQTGVADVLVELLALALRGAESTARADDRTTARLLALIEDRLDDPQLGPVTLAAEMGISARSLQKLLAARNTTPSAYVMNRRLMRAAEMLLCDPQRSITQIAFSLGFNDSAYFSRCFRRRFNIPPTVYRARGVSAAPVRDYPPRHTL